MIEELLNKFGVKFEDLNSAEKETLKNWLGAVSKNELSIEKIKEYLRSMLSGVEREISEGKLPRYKDVFLKARIRNYLLLLDFLESPEKAKKALENNLKNIK